MSKIEAELKKATEVARKRGEDEQDYLERLAKAANELADADFNSLSEETDTWLNSAFDALEAKKDIPGFPDTEKEEAASTGRRRRGAAEETTKDEGPCKPKVGDEVKVVTKRGKEATGKVTESDDEILVIKTADGVEEFNPGRLESVTLLGGKAPAKDADEPDPIKVGAQVTAVTKRGKEYTGKIVELDAEVIVIKTASGDEEVARDRIETIKVDRGTPAADKDSDKPAGRSRRGSGEKSESKEKAERGPSVGLLARELLVEHYAETGKVLDKDTYIKQVQKQAPSANESTLNIAFGDFERILELFKKHKLVK